MNNSKYVRVKINGKLYEEHRLVWEKYNGVIPDGYVIHHIDRVKNNNDIKNLQMMTQSDHIKLHIKLDNIFKTPNNMDKETYNKWLESSTKANKRKIYPIIDGKLICIRCKELLPLEKFSKKKEKINGYESACRKCRSNYRKNLNNLKNVI